MKTAILNVKVDEQVKKKAQAVAGGFWHTTKYSC
jgi:antitoxin component of RelBE/YafQ-DinJ toxin-antitoxin module